MQGTYTYIEYRMDDVMLISTCVDIQFIPPTRLASCGQPCPKRCHVYHSRGNHYSRDWSVDSAVSDLLFENLRDRPDLCLLPLHTRLQFCRVTVWTTSRLHFNFHLTALLSLMVASYSASQYFAGWLSSRRQPVNVAV